MIDFKDPSNRKGEDEKQDRAGARAGALDRDDGSLGRNWGRGNGEKGMDSR